MSGHVKLGAVGALREYYLKSQGGDGLAWSRGPANPFTSNVNTSGKYDKVDDWTEWVQEDWQTGVGRVDPEGGGFLYGEVDSRVPNQFILAQAMKIYTPFVRDNASNYKSWSLSPGQLSASITRTTYALANNTYLAWQFDGDTTAGNNDISGVWVYGECADGTVLRCDLYSDTTSNPNASLANASLTVTNDFPGPQWHFIPVILAGRTHTTETWVVLRPTTGSFTGHGVSNLSPAMLVRSSPAVVSWSSVTTFQPFFVIQAVHASNPRYVDDISITTSSDEVIFWGRHGTGLSASVYGWARHASYPYLVQVKSFTAQIVPPVKVSVAVHDNEIIAGSGVGGVYLYRTSMALSGETISTGGESMLSHGGYLWASNSFNDLAYYATFAGGSTTVGPVCALPWGIRSMAGMSGDVYCACDDGLYRIAPGDFVEGIVPWQPDDDNGKAMVSHAGALYVVVNGRVWRYGQEGTMRDIWVARDDDLPSSRLGEVVGLAATDLWVVALVKSTTGRCSVWAYQDEGWHHIATLPTFTANAMKYIRINATLWISTSDGYAFGVYLPANALNPYNDSSSLYMPAGWIQQDRYKGGQHLIDKAFYSVTVVGDNLSTNVNAKIYWQDEGSTGWELLGTADSDGEELIWPTSTRPHGKWIKLGALLQTNDADETPRIRALVVKLLTIVNDRRQDQMTLTLKDYQQGPNGEKDTYTHDQQKTHLESLIGFDGANTNFVFLYEDPYGVQMEVTLASHQWNIPTFAFENSARKAKESEVTIVLKQLPDTLYSA